jgi:hypothetical protein
MAMNKTAHKSLSVIFTSLIIVTLILMGPASAINIIISEPNDANQGENVTFQVKVDLDTPDMYVPLAYTNLIFTNPDGSNFECKVFNDGSTNCGNIDVITTIDATYGEGPQLGYGYGYGYGYDYTYFGYGYGYGYQGENGQITYDITLHLDSNSQVGEHKVKAETYVATEDSNDDNQGFGYCDTMLGMYESYNYSLSHNGSFYDPVLDLHPDGKIDLSDVSVFATNHFSINDSGDSVLFGRFVEFFRYRGNQGINPELDVYPEDGGDGILNLSDYVIFASHYYADGSEAWCADQISLIPGVERIYISNEVSFEVSSVPVDEPNPSGGPSSTGGKSNLTKTCAEGYFRDELSGFCLLEKSAEDETEKEASVTGGEEDGTTQTGQTGNNVFSAITGAVVGAGEKIGLGETFSYLLTLFLLALIISGIVRVSRKRI